MESTLAEVLRAKHERLVFAEADDPVRRAVRLMNEGRIGSVLVLNRGQLVGIFTERDVLVRVIEGHANLNTPLAEVMTAPVLCAPPHMRVGRAMRLLTDHRTRHLPVLDDEVLVGIVSIGDLAHWVTRELQQSVDDLSSYICGPAVVAAKLASLFVQTGDDVVVSSFIGRGSSRSPHH